MAESQYPEGSMLRAWEDFAIALRDFGGALLAEFERLVAWMNARIDPDTRSETE